ncbi:PepSY domain-containing protein [Chitinibacter fontanus]|uniref:PepSY domain-containing protein n=1 Tax=Chitinibacter fontanus TaxID=1737446 RepID=A0A7D5ZF66_9NEIS|nr:PepSY domain-containing protein [Chitinibacter fontanus]QLI80749.1 PepSY domain-containing protein [Chitinibacter fontanus]
MKRDELDVLTTQTGQRKTSVLGWLNRWHKKLAWIAGIAVIFWGLTGVLHPIMSALTPNVHPLPVALSLPADLQVVPPASLRLPAGAVQSLRLRMWGDDTPAWRIGMQAQPVGIWFDARNGQVLANADAQEAERLARALVGDPQSAIRSLTPITEFSRSYPSINKILPVWRVEFVRDDGMVAFVDTEGRRLASLSDNTKRSLMPIFSLLHTWSWASEPVKKLGMTLVLLVALLSMIGGLAMYWLRYRRQTLKATQPALRRFHRGLGVAAGLAGLVITFSGLTHLWLQRAPFQAAAPQPLTVLPELHHMPVGVSSLIAVNVGAKGYWLVEQSDKNAAVNTGGGHQHGAHHAASALPTYLNEHGAVEEGIAARHAMQMLRQLAPKEAQVHSANLQSLTLITQFGGEYGFFQKRLPVYRVDLATPSAASWYLEPATGTFSTRVENSDRFEGYLFANLHKWHWLDGLGKTSRDVILASFAALNVVLAVCGLWLLRRRKVGKN